MQQKENKIQIDNNNAIEFYSNIYINTNIKNNIKYIVLPYVNMIKKKEKWNICLVVNNRNAESESTKMLLF